MIKNFLVFLFLLPGLISCNSKTVKPPVTDVEVATAFVRNILDNKFTEAEQYLLKDETNTEMFKRFRQQYTQKDKKVLDKYQDADIIVNEISYVTDTICIFNYSNSYIKEEKTKLKVVRVDSKWLIDFKYTFSGNL